MAQQIKNNLSKIKDYKYLKPGKYNKDVEINSKHIYKIANIIYDLIFKLFPNLNIIYNYLIEI
jgi:hypothetical protein